MKLSNLGHFLSSKNFKLLKFRDVVYHFEELDLENQNIYFVSRNI